MMKVGDKLAILGVNNVLYDISEDYKIVSEQKLAFKSDLIVNSEDYILSYTNQKAIDFQSDSLLYELLLFDKDFNLIQKGFKFNPKIGESRFHFRLSQNIQVNKEGFLFTKFLSDTIYQISQNGVSPKFTIDFKNKGLTSMRILT